MHKTNASILEKGFLNEFQYESKLLGAPQWFKLWAEKYATALDVDTLEDELEQSDYEKVCRDIGTAFVHALRYFMHHDELKERPEINFFRPETRDGRHIWNAFKRDIDQAYRDYEKRVVDGAKGGRPRQER